MRENIISIKNVKKSYGEKLVLDRLNLEVEKGSIFALLGENGAGKTTTVRILSTLIQYDDGFVTIADYDCRKDAKAIRNIISLTGQYAAVDELLTGEENLYMMGRLNGLDRDTTKQRVSKLLTQFDLEKVAKKLTKTYSGGTRRRLDIAISLLAYPKVIFLDEPTTGLDPRSRRNMWDLIKELANSGVTIFLTTQYLEEADNLADTIAVIHNGKIVAKGTADELKNVIRKERVEFIFQEKDIQRAQEILNGKEKDNCVSVAVTNKGAAETLRQLLNILHQQGIEPESVSISKPTLDDVFMNITSNKKESEEG